VSTTAEAEPRTDVAPVAKRKSTRSRVRQRTSLASQGEPAVWLLGGSLIVSLVMIAGLLGIVFFQGFFTFWPDSLTSFELTDGRVLMGEVRASEDFEPDPTFLAGLPEADRARIDSELVSTEGTARRRLLRTGNFDLTGNHFNWVSDYEIATESEPEWAVIVERLTWGRFYGTPVAFRIDGESVATEPALVWAEFERHHDPSVERFDRRRELETEDIGVVNHRLERGRLDLRRVELQHGLDSAAWRSANEDFLRLEAEASAEFAQIQGEIAALNEENERYELVLSTSDGSEKSLFPAEIVRAFPANQLSITDKIGVYISRWIEFLVADPREANSEGGVFPAIFGTVVMTLLMTIVVVPFGVLSALYLREYAKQGLIVSAVRIAVNNLAGVPSIVFGVFGLGFFCYLVGGGIDELFFSAKLPNPTFGTGGVMWASLTLALLTLPVVIVATEESLSAVPNSMREGSYACGATKWQTIRRIVLPRAAPGIMTGAILAIARGAGEVAPLMLVGAVKLAPELPLDGVFPFVHAERSFMHLGFHIFDLGFQSQNSEAAKPMVYTTTLLLIAIIVALNLLAIWGRARLRRRFHGNSI